MAGPRKKDRRTVRDLVPSDLVFQKLYCTTREDAIRELLNALVIQGVIDLSREEETRAAILDRESVASTGIGHGIAMPHAKSKFAERFGLAVGISEDGIDFKAHDGSAARVIFLWVCPPAQTKQHLALMRALASVGQDPDNTDRMAACRDRRGLLKLLEEFELEEKK
jgi:mannitol/fructose-specific phosphotransferase system IIA component (Ntr-type)